MKERNGYTMEQVEEMFVFRKEIIEKIKKFPRAHEDTDLVCTAEQMIHISDRLYREYKKSMHGKFEFKEVLVMCEAIGWGVDMTSINNFKAYVIMNIEDSIIYNYSNVRFGVNKDKLLCKVSQLSEIESLTLIMMVIETLNKETGECSELRKVVEETFGVSE